MSPTLHGSLERVRLSLGVRVVAPEHEDVADASMTSRAARWERDEPQVPSMYSEGASRSTLCFAVTL